MRDCLASPTFAASADAEMRSTLIGDDTNFTHSETYEYNIFGFELVAPFNYWAQKNI